VARAFESAARVPVHRCLHAALRNSRIAALQPTEREVETSRAATSTAHAAALHLHARNAQRLVQ